MSRDFNAVEEQVSLTVDLDEGNILMATYREIYGRLRDAVDKDVADTLEVVVHEVALARKGAIQ